MLWIYTVQTLSQVGVTRSFFDLVKVFLSLCVQALHLFWLSNCSSDAYFKLNTASPDIKQSTREIPG